MSVSALERVLSRVERQSDGCWLWTGSTVGHMGYGRVSVGGVLWLAHRFVYANVVGPIPTRSMVLHGCDNPRCLNPEHLYLGDHQRNMDDKVERGRAFSTRGEINGRALVGCDDVRAIRSQYDAGGISQRELGSRFGLSRQAVSRITRGETWAHVAAGGRTL